MQIIFSSLYKKAKDIARNGEIQQNLLKPHHTKLISVINRINSTYKKVYFFNNVNKVYLASLLDFISRKVCADSTFSQCINSQKVMRMISIVRASIYALSVDKDILENEDKLIRLTVALLLEEVIISMKVSGDHYSSIEFK